MSIGGHFMELTIEQALQQGVSAHNSGDLQEAERVYRAILQSQPTHPDANHNLGLIAISVNNAEAALPLFKAALDVNSRIEQFWVSYIDALIKVTQFKNAKRAIKKARKAEFSGEKVSALELQMSQIMQGQTEGQEALMQVPSQAEIDSLLGSYQSGQYETARDVGLSIIERFPRHSLSWKVLGALFSQAGQIDEALIANQNAVGLAPNDAEAHSNLGVVLNEMNRFVEAESSYRQAIVINSEFAEAHYNLGNTLTAQGSLEEAEASYIRGIVIKPDYVDAYCNLGTVQKDLGRLMDAEASYRQAIELKPDNANAHSNLGATLLALGRLLEAEVSCRQAVALKPDYAEAHSNLGITLQELGNLDQAEASSRQAIALKVDYAEAYSNLGITLQEQGRLREAETSYRQAIALKPDHANTHSNLGALLEISKKLDEALKSYEHAMALEPHLDYLQGALLLARMRLCVWDGLPQSLVELTRRITNGERASAPFPLHGLIDRPDLHRKAAEITSKHKYLRSDILPKISPYTGHEKIRVGYFSPDFRNHPVSALTAELYESHDRARFEIHAFSFGKDSDDEWALRIKAGVDHFHDVCAMSDEDVAMLSRSVELDIAVDLTGLTKGCRPGIFAMSAAPIQLGYLGFLGTMGADYYDYLISDKTIIPECNKQYYAESIVYLPSFQVNSSQNYTQDTLLDRGYFNIPEDVFVFCCFNNTYKVTPDVFDSWARILKQVEGSVLVLYADNDIAISNLQKHIKARGIDPGRLIFGGYLARVEYLARYRVADLFLDTLPYNAGATASDALRMGLPVLTQMGESFAGRMGASLLNAVNLPELVTTTSEGYEALAVDLATNAEKLSAIKKKLISNVPTARLYDAPLFTNSLEAAYLIMYDRYQSGERPQDIDIEK